MILIAKDLQTGNASSELAGDPEEGGTPGQSAKQRVLGNGLQMQENVGQLRQPWKNLERTSTSWLLSHIQAKRGFNISA